MADRAARGAELPAAGLRRRLVQRSLWRRGAPGPGQPDLLQPRPQRLPGALAGDRPGRRRAIRPLRRLAGLARRPDLAGAGGGGMAAACTLLVALLLAHSTVDYPLRTETLAVLFAFACATLAAWRPE